MSHATTSPPASPDRAIVAVLLTSRMRQQMLSPRAQERLAASAAVRVAADSLEPGDLPALIEGASAVLTGWGTPPLDMALLAAHPALWLVSHSAGSIRKLVPLQAVESGRLRVSHAAHHIAAAVAEFVIAQTLSVLREPHAHDAGMKAGAGWFELRERHLGRLLGTMTVGIVGAGYVGRAVIRLFQAFGCRILLADPVVTAGQASALGAEAVTLDTLLGESDIVSLHAPVLPETRNMIGAREFARMHDGALFINTARSLLVDQEAQLAALRTGRIRAILDVYDEEPLSPDSPLRLLPHVWLSPHAAGHTADTHKLQGDAAVDDICRFLRGEALQHEVRPSVLATMA